MKNNILLILSVCFLYSCKNHSEKPGTNKASATATHRFPPVSEKEKQQYSKKAESFLTNLLDKHGFNGSYLVAKNGEVILEKYVGFTDILQKTNPILPNAAFHLASVSKTFTAMAVLKLWQEKKLNIEDDLSVFFPGFPYPGITVKMLLNHRSGLPNYVHFLEQNGWDKKKMVTNLDVLSSLYTMRPPLQFPSGKHFSYCNTNYVLLALIVEKVSNISFSYYLQKNFFEPYGMKDSYVFSMRDSARAMPSFEWNNRQFGMEFLDLTYGDKNIYSTVRDMLKWDQALYNENLFSKATLDAAFSPYSFEKDGKKNYGLGWRMTLLDNGKKLIYHNGWWHGNNTVFIRLIDENATIIVLGNKFNRSIYKSKKLADIFGNYGQDTDSPEDRESDSSKNELSTGSPK